MSGGASYAVPVENYGTDIETVGGIGAETGKVQELVDADGKVRQYILVKALGTIPWGEFCVADDSGTDLLYGVSNASSAGEACVGVAPYSDVAVGGDTGLSSGDYFWMQVFGEAVVAAAGSTARGILIATDATGKAAATATSGHNFLGWSQTAEGTPASGYLRALVWVGVGSVP